MINKDLIGWTFPLQTVEVEKGRLRFFASVIGETNPIYTNEADAKAAGYRSLPILPTFLFCLEDSGLLHLLEEQHISIERLLHGEQSFTYYQPICAGDSITFHSMISDIYTKKGGLLDCIIQDTTVNDQDGVLVATLRNLVIVRN